MKQMSLASNARLMRGRAIGGEQDEGTFYFPCFDLCEGQDGLQVASIASGNVPGAVAW